MVFRFGSLLKNHFSIIPRLSNHVRISTKSSFQQNLILISLLKFWHTVPARFTLPLKAATPVLCTSLFVLKAASTLDKSKLKTMLTQADEYYDTQKFQELFDLLNPHKDEGNEEILWRLARAIYELVRYDKDQEKLQGLNKAYEYVQKALEINDNCGPAHKWCSILLDARSNLMGVTAKMSNAASIRDHIQRAVELIPEDSTSHHVLGAWHYAIADLPWYQRQLVAASCRSSLNASFEEALQHFQRAEAANPNGFSKNLLMIGKTYLKLKQKDKAIEFLKQTRDYPQKTANDKEAFEEAVALLKQLGVE